MISLHTLRLLSSSASVVVICLTFPVVSALLTACNSLQKNNSNYWPHSVMVRTLDLPLKGLVSDSQPLHSQVKLTTCSLSSSNKIRNSQRTVITYSRERNYTLCPKKVSP